MPTNISKLVLAGTLLIGGIANSVNADWYFRGTANNWSSTALTSTGVTTFETCQTFTSSDANGGTRFKIDRLGTWSEAYPVSSDYLVNPNTTYKIKFDSNSKVITTEAVASCNAFNKIFPSLNVRGTFNNWASTPLVLTANNTWQVTVKLDGQANQRFKFDVTGDWSQNYGDNNNDKYLDQSGADIIQTGSGDYKITVNDSTKLFKIEAVCTTNCSSSSSSSSGAAVKTLGAVYSPTSTTFSLWSPDSSNVSVKIKGVVYAMRKTSTDFNGYTNVYQATVQGDLRLAEYNFIVNGVDVRDPYAKMAKPQTNSSIVMDMSRTTISGGWAARPVLSAREDAIIYEAHVRDFTIDSSSGVDANKRGKFLGMVQPGTSYSGVKTSIDHLKELGVTHVQLLPAYDFHSCDGLPDSNPCYNWGYDPRNFNVPEDRYSQTPLDYENRAREFKIMVNEFHKAGIRVILDVVYNHTHSKEMFEPITNKYYTAVDLSGCCGNSVNGDEPMVSRMIQDSLEYWVQEYGIDGFRFDLMGIFSHAEAERWQKNLTAKFPDRNLLIFGEPWTGASDPDEAKHVRYGTTRLMQHVGVFNGAFRDAIKGNNDGTSRGYMYNNIAPTEAGWAISDGMRGSPYDANDTRNGTWFRNFATDPEQTINYISAHDNLNLWDKIYLTLSTNVVQDSAHQVQSLTPPSDLGYAKRVANFGMGIVLTSQGIPMISSGDEFLRSKTNNGQSNIASAWNYNSGGAMNSYEAPDSFNAIRWNDKIINAPTFKYFKDAISFRRNHSGVRMNTQSEVSQYLAIGNAANYNGEVITGYITSPKDNSELFIVYNSGANRAIDLPSGTWTQVLNTTGANTVNNLSSTVVVEGTAVTVFTKPH